MHPGIGAALEGRYTIEDEIGRGGMATVYRARDVRHNRNVALKFLDPELGAVLGVERFLAEIRVTANLQHPNILPLFDSGEVNGLLFYVMPYVEGESLRARLTREKQLPVEEALRIATALAGALDYAHRHNVVHRDLKPENILMQEGQPLIADFGIALAVSNAGGARITQTGLSLGTPQYMSPEQATGDRVVDGRTDIYSLGAMTYEMLVGDPPHVASTTQAVIAKVLTEKPASVRTGRPSVPAHVDAAIGGALEKLAADRFATAKEFADALHGKGAAPTLAPSRAASPYASAAGRPSAREIVAWSAALLLAALLGWRQSRSEPHVDAPVVRVNFDLPPGARVNDVVTGTTIAVSPAGDAIAFTSASVNGFKMYVRRVNDLAAHEILAAVGRNLTFSPDGRWLAFTEGNALRKVEVAGGEAVTLGSSGSTVPYGLAWSPNDTIYIGGFSGMWKVPSSGGTPTLVPSSDSSQMRAGRRWPMVLPGGKAIAYANGSSSSATPHLAVMALGSGKTVNFDVQVAMPLAMLDDQLVFVSPSGGLMAVRFDKNALKPIGDPVQIDDGVLVDPTAGAKASLSASGTLAYLRGRAQFQVVLADRSTAIPTAIIREPGTYSTPRLSPDGTRIAITVQAANATDIWIYDLARHTFTRLSTEGANVRPEWTPDGRSVTYISARAGKTAIWRQAADGSAPAEMLYEPAIEPFEAIVSPDQQWLVFRTAPGVKYSRDILAVPLTGERTVKEVVVGPET